MGRGAAAAVAQAQQISNKESLELVKCLLRVVSKPADPDSRSTTSRQAEAVQALNDAARAAQSIFHVSFLRGFFPDDKFQGVDMKNLDGMHIKMLRPCCEESQRLVDWVEQGVADALVKGYLKNMFFGISEDPAGAELLEEYVFSFSYGDGGVDMEVVAGSKARKSKGSFRAQGTGANVNTVRYQVIRLMRMLVQMCQTLEQVPSERYIFMKLTYQDHTPDDYEPPCFLPVMDGSIGHFRRQPFSMHLGTVDTDHHTVALRIKSVLDAVNDPADIEPEAEGMGSQQVDTMDVEAAQEGHLDRAQAAAGTETAIDAPGQQLQQQQHPAARMLSPGAGGAGDEQHGDAVTEVTQASEGAVAVAAAETLGPQCDLQILDQLQAYCMQRSQVHFADAMVQFMDAREEVLEGCFQELVAQGVLVVGSSPDVYCVRVDAGQQSNDVGGVGNDAVEDLMTVKMSGLSVGMGPAAVSAAHGIAPRAGQLAAQDRKRQVAADASVAAKLQSNHAGSAATLAPAEKAPPLHVHDLAHPASGSNGTSVQQADGIHHQFHFDGSQQSLLAPKGAAAGKRAAGVKRKASFVTQPIHQTANKGGGVKKAAKARLQAMKS